MNKRVELHDFILQPKVLHYMKNDLGKDRMEWINFNEIGN